jgi:hypothetical protein
LVAALLKRAALRFAALVLPAILIMGCGGPEPSHYSAILDGLNVPNTWEVVQTVVKAPTGGDIACTPAATDDCPSVSRYYVVATDSAVAVFAQGEDLLKAAGFKIDREFFPACDAPRSGPACSASSKRGSDFADIGIFRPGDDAASVVAAREGAAIVVVTAHAD